MSIGPLQPGFSSSSKREYELNTLFKYFVADTEKTKIAENLLQALKGEILFDKGWREILEHLYRHEPEFLRHAFLVNIRFEDTPEFYEGVLHKAMGPFSLWDVIVSFAELGFSDLAISLCKETGHLASIQRLPRILPHRYAPKPPSEKE